MDEDENEVIEIVESGFKDNRNIGGHVYGQDIVMDNKQRAGKNLFIALEKYSDIFSKDKRHELRNRYINLPQLTFMNPNMLACAIAFDESHEVNMKRSPLSYTNENVLPYFSKIENRNSFVGEDGQKLLDRYKLDLIRYLYAINEYKSTMGV
jgi:hypothetical protein